MNPRMGVSLEIRWFLSTPPIDREFWFRDIRPSPTRIDWYAFPCDVRSGVKVREGRFEAKLRLAECGAAEFGAVRGRLERWTKSSVVFPPGEVPQVNHLDSAGWKAVAKTRWQRMFQLEGDMLRETQTLDRTRVSCQFEWTEITFGREIAWWTIGLEAYGAAPDQEQILNLVASEQLARLPAPSSLQEEASCGYPEWLRRVFADHD